MNVIEGSLAVGKVDSVYWLIKETIGERKQCSMNMGSLDAKPLVSNEKSLTDEKNTQKPFVK